MLAVKIVIFLPPSYSSHCDILRAKCVSSESTPERVFRLVLATTMFVVASRIAYEYSTTASSIFTTFTRRAVN